MFACFESDALGSHIKVRRIKVAKSGRDAEPLPVLDTTASVAMAPCKKRNRPCPDARGAAADGLSPAKWQRQDDQDPTTDDPVVSDDASPTSSPDPARLTQVRDIISNEFSLEILFKHNELRLIQQELAKCQTALEQLRRCHLIPYPQFCPTPDQMLDITDGKGCALLPPSGTTVPRWAPPFGVVDGPYSRHYARWLIPDPSFDGEQGGLSPAGTLRRARNPMAAGRATRKSLSNPSGGRGRARPPRGRAHPQPRHYPLPTPYPQVKGKPAGPCIVIRPDGSAVKLVCLDCRRDSFSSTQGFINHCRIAHKRDLRSHGEAVTRCGQPIEDPNLLAPITTTTSSAPQAAGAMGTATRTPAAVAAPTASAAALASPALPAAFAAPPAAPPAAATRISAASKSALVHPLARAETTEQQAIAALRARIDASLQMYCAGQTYVAHHFVPADAPEEASSSSTSVSARAAAAAAHFLQSPDAPHLSRFMEGRRFHGSLSEIVADATKKTCLDDEGPSDVEADETDPPSDTNGPDEHAPRAPTTLPTRMPTRTTAARRPVQSSVRIRSLSDKKEVNARAAKLGVARPAHDDDNEEVNNARAAKLASPAHDDEEAEDEDVYGSYAAKSGGGSSIVVLDDADLSPNTATSNNAPSLISDDGEYDDSDASSVESASESAEEAPITVDTEVTTDYEQDAPTMRRDSGSAPVGTTMRLRKDDAKHATFLGSLARTPTTPTTTTNAMTATTTRRTTRGRPGRIL